MAWSDHIYLLEVQSRSQDGNRMIVHSPDEPLPDEGTEIYWASREEGEPNHRGLIVTKHDDFSAEIVIELD